MQQYNNIITCASFGGTGSSVITDLLKEFDNVKSFGDYEFSLLHEVDGISDLQHYLVDDFHRLKTDEGIYRFNKLINRISKEYNDFFNGNFNSITNKYMDSLTDVMWNGYWHQHGFRYSEIERKIFYRIPERLQRIKQNITKNKTGYEYVPYFKRSPMSIGYCSEDKFLNLTQQYMEELFNEINKQKFKYLALDQLVPPTNIERYTKYFKSIKVIVVDRDPRDLYLLNKLFWKEGWIPTDDVEVYVKWFELLRKPLKHEKDLENNVLRIQFEDLICDYDRSLDKILKFLNILSSDHKYKKKYFNPDKSRKNYRIWDKYLDYTEDIKFIEKQLSDYCYDKH